MANTKILIKYNKPQSMKKYSLILLLLIVHVISTAAQDKWSNPSQLALKDQSLLISVNGKVQALVLADCSLQHLGSDQLHINGQYGDIYSIEGNINALQTLAQNPCVKWIELSTKLNATQIKNDIERVSTSVDKVQNGLANGLPINYSGKGVVVGIVDVGFQCNNPSFYSADGKTYRVSKYWQQSNTNGPKPAGFSYGTEFTDSASISKTNDMDGSHATHVAAIAAGSGLSTPNLQYRGMAPEAELVFVSIKYSNDTLAGSALGDYIVANPTILDAYKYIFDYAQSVGKPAVINLSWGMHTGPHDGNSLFDKATETLVGQGKVLVGANGNEGDNLMHWSHQFNQDTVSTILIENNRQWQSTESVYVDFWGNANSNFSVQLKLIDSSQQTVASTPFVNAQQGSQGFKYTLADGSIFKVNFACVGSYPNNSKPNITVMADHQNTRKYIMVASINADATTVHAWNSGASKSWTSGSFRNKVGKWNYSSQFISGNTDYTAGENGGSSKAVISVGAMAARSAYRNIKNIWVNDSGYVTPGNITKFSSKGPTVDGRVKPNITAPGYDVPSAINNKQFAGWMADKTLLKTVFQNDTQYWVAFNGTSMAAPHVTGIVALLLQANPKLSANQVKDILESTATVDQNTGTVPNMQYGYGKVNAFAAVQKALQYAGINQSISNSHLSLYPNPSQTWINFNNTSDCHIALYNANGALCLSSNASANAQLNIEELAQGLYMVQVTIGGEIFFFKLLKTAE